MAAEEEYQRTGFEGKDLKVIDTLLHTYFDASGWEFSELIQANTSNKEHLPIPINMNFSRIKI